MSVSGPEIATGSRDSYVLQPLRGIGVLGLRYAGEVGLLALLYYGAARLGYVF